jgi:general L-amino acid transport system substrate-binding protein
MRNLKFAAVAVIATTAALSMPAFAGNTLDAIKARDAVACGVNIGLAGFSTVERTTTFHCIAVRRD